MKRDAPYVYVVAWDDTIVKIGYSARKRWRAFTARGAQIVTLVPFDSGIDALRCESAMHKAAMASWKYAFRTREDAKPYLGRDGSGWVECYQATAETARHFAASIVTAHRDDALPRTMRVTDARTDERTD